MSYAPSPLERRLSAVRRSLQLPMRPATVPREPMTTKPASEPTMNDLPYLVDAHQAAGLLGMSLRKFRDDCRLPDFPPARSLGPRSTRWVRSELLAYAISLPAVRRAEPEQLAAARAARAAGMPTAHAPFPTSQQP